MGREQSHFVQKKSNSKNFSPLENDIIKMLVSCTQHICYVLKTSFETDSLHSLTGKDHSCELLHETRVNWFHMNLTWISCETRVKITKIMFMWNSLEFKKQYSNNLKMCSKSWKIQKRLHWCHRTSNRTTEYF